MKKISRYILAALWLATASCSDTTLDKIDTNPNNPTDAPTYTILGNAIVQTSFSVLGTDASWYSAVYVEHVTGIHGQLEDAEKRAPGALSNTAHNNTWGNIYTGSLQDLKVVIEKADKEGIPTYKGIAKVMQAVNLGVATDLFGDIPASQANAGVANLKPKYDKQEEVYALVIQLLRDARKDLTVAPTGALLANLKKYDMIYGGDVAKWTKASWALEARFLNRQSKRKGTANDAAILTAVQNAFASNSDDMSFNKFTTEAIGEHPWFQERNDRGMMGFSQSFGTMLTDLNDPRLSIWAGVIAAGPNAGKVIFAPNGTPQNDQAGVLYSKASAEVVNSTAKLPIITFDELKFIEAEVKLRANDQVAAVAAYKKAIESAIARGANGKVAASAVTDYLASEKVVPAAGIKLEDVIKQKYIALWQFQSIEAYNDYRRTGFPKLANAKPAPRRFQYAQNELDNNAANVPAVTIATNVWFAQ